MVPLLLALVTKVQNTDKNSKFSKPVVIVKYLLILFKFNHSILDWTALWNFGRIFGNIFRGVCVQTLSFIGIIWWIRTFLIYCSLAFTGLSTFGFLNITWRVAALDELHSHLPWTRRPAATRQEITHDDIASKFGPSLQK